MAGPVCSWELVEKKSTFDFTGDTAENVAGIILRSGGFGCKCK